jgi:hypothetical protein
MRKKKQLLANILVLFFTVLLTFLILEASFRLFLFGRDSFSVTKMNSVHHIGDAGLLQPSNHPEIAFELKPNLNTYFKLASFKTNSQGLRDKEYEISKPNNTFRVAVIGDSFTMASGVEIEEAFHTLLEDKLNKEHRNLTYELINFAVGGYSLRQYWAIIKYKAREYNPDLIIIGFCPFNDHQISPDEIFKQPFKAKDKTYPFYRSFVIDQFLTFIKIRQHKTDNGDKEKKGNTQQQRLQYISEIFTEMYNFSKNQNIPIVIANLSHRYDPKRSKPLEEMVVSSGLYFVDLSLPFKGTNVRKYRIYAIDDHPNNKANRIFAEQLYDYLHKMNFIRSE